MKRFAMNAIAASIGVLSAATAFGSDGNFQPEAPSLGTDWVQIAPGVWETSEDGRVARYGRGAKSIDFLLEERYEDRAQILNIKNNLSAQTKSAVADKAEIKALKQSAMALEDVELDIAELERLKRQASTKDLNWEFGDPSCIDSASTTVSTSNWFSEFAFASASFSHGDPSAIVSVRASATTTITDADLGTMVISDSDSETGTLSGSVHASVGSNIVFDCDSRGASARVSRSYSSGCFYMEWKEVTEQCK